MHLTALLPLSILLTLSLALPQVRPSPLATTFTVTDFSTWLTPAPSSPHHPNFAKFALAGSDASSYQCIVTSQQPLYSDIQSYPCVKLSGGGAKDAVYFRLTPGFNEVEIKRIRQLGGLWITEWATEGTYWNEGAGGNVSSTALNGKWYQRQQLPWVFTVTRTSG